MAGALSEPGPAEWSWELGSVAGEAAPPAPPPEIPGYRLGEELGRGGMGAVYRARDPQGRAVAVKVLLEARLAPSGVARFAREVELLSRLSHPHVVTAHAWGRTGHVVWLACELVEGQLIDAAARGRPLEARLELIVQAARGVAALHASGIVHRDLKPGNLLVSAAGQVKLIDLGVSTGEGVAPLTRTGQFLGTPLYAPPERLRGTAAADLPTGDVWSLGAIAYELLSGARPYPLENDLQLALRDWGLDRGPPPPPRRLEPRITPALERVLLAALDRDPARRPADGAALLALLEAARAGADPLRPRRPGLPGLPWALAAGGLLGALALGGWLLRPAPLPGAAPGSGASAAAPHSHGPSAFVMLGQAAAKRQGGDLAGAEADLDRALAQEPGLARIWLERGLVRGKRGNVAGALEDLDRALALAPTDARTLVERGATRRQLGDASGGLADLERAIALDPQLALAWFVRGNARWDAGQARGAIADYDRAIALDPLLAEAWVNRGLVRERVGDPQGALADYERALELGPMALAHYHRGRFLRLRGELAAALADLDRALELAPELQQSWFERGLARARSGDLSGARSDLDRALELDPRDTQALVQRGLVRRRAGDLAAARADFERAIALDPRYAPAWSNRGALRHTQGDLPGAVADLERALELDPDQAQVWGVLGLALEALGQPERARSALERALTLQPKAAWAEEVRAALRRLGPP